MSALHAYSAPPPPEPATEAVSTPPPASVARLPGASVQCAAQRLPLKHVILDWYELPVDVSQASQLLSDCTTDIYPILMLGIFDDPTPDLPPPLEILNEPTPVETWGPTSPTPILPPPLEVPRPGVAFTPNDPRLAQQWHIAKISAPLAWDTSKGDDVTIAILDTGIFCGHPDIIGKCVSAGRDFINEDMAADDDNGHGTHVAGAAAALTNNGIGVAGVGYNARLLPVKCLAANGSGSTAVIARCIDWASQQSGVKVINMSLGAVSGRSDPMLADAIRLARSRGVAVIASAGNSNTDTFTTPAAEVGVIGIGATDQNDNRAAFSNFGQNADIGSPGVSILSTVKPTLYESWQGTSMAAPLAAGVYALAAAACSSCSLEELERRLLDGDPITTDKPIGGKRINAARAVRGGTGPTLTPAVTFTPGPSATPAPDFDTETVNEINRRRAEAGLPAFIIDPRLTDIAHQHNDYMGTHGCFAHDCEGEPTVWQRLASAGYPNFQGSEIIGMGCPTVSCMVNGWMGSTGHRAVILGNYTHIGCNFGDYAGGYHRGLLWTCNAGRRSGVQPTSTFTPRPPVATPTHTPTPGPTPTPWAGWSIVITVPYDNFTPAEIDALYREFCVGLVGRGVRCAWIRDRPP